MPSLVVSPDDLVSLTFLLFDVIQSLLLTDPLRQLQFDATSALSDLMA